MMTRWMWLIVGLAACVLLGAGCDRSESTLTINDDGSAAWSRVVTFTRDGQWAQDFDALQEAAIADRDQPDNFVRTILPVLLPQLAGLGDEELIEATGATMGFTNLVLDTTDDTVTFSASRTVDEFQMLPEGLFPGRFSLTADGHNRYSIDNDLQTRSLLPLDQVEGATGDRGWGGDTLFTLTVPGAVVSHNAHEVIGTDADGTTLQWDWLSTARADGAVDVVWDPTATPPAVGGWTGRRFALLGVAALALAVGTGVLLTFRPPDFDHS